MIKIFTGKWLGPGGGRDGACGLILDFHFREIISHFHGAKLAVFMVIALHCNENGESWPGYETIIRESGYGVNTVAKTIGELQQTYINGHRVLAVTRQRDERGRFFGNNHYRIFPDSDSTAEDVWGDDALDLPDGADTDTPLKPNSHETQFGASTVEVKPSIKLNQLSTHRGQNQSDLPASGADDGFDNAENDDLIPMDESLPLYPTPGWPSQPTSQVPDEGQPWEPQEADIWAGFLTPKVDEPKALEAESAADRYKKRIRAALEKGAAQHRREVLAGTAVDVGFFPENTQPYARAFALASGFRPTKRDIARWRKEINDQIDFGLTPQDITDAVGQMREAGLSIKSPGSVTAMARDALAKRTVGRNRGKGGAVLASDGGLYV